MKKKESNMGFDPYITDDADGNVASHKNLDEARKHIQGLAEEAFGDVDEIDDTEDLVIAVYQLVSVVKTTCTVEVKKNVVTKNIVIKK